MKVSYREVKRLVKGFQLSKSRRLKRQLAKAQAEYDNLLQRDVVNIDELRKTKVLIEAILVVLRSRKHIGRNT